MINPAAGMVRHTIVTRSLEINPGSTQKLTGISFLIKRNCRSVAISEIFLQKFLEVIFPLDATPPQPSSQHPT